MEQITGLFYPGKNKPEEIPLCEKEMKTAIYEASKALLETPVYSQKELKKVMDDRTYGVPTTSLEAQSAEIFRFLRKCCLPELYSLISRMPKGGNLHFQFDGGLSAEDWMKLSFKKGLYWDFDKKEMLDHKSENAISADKFSDWPVLTQDFKKAVTWKKTDDPLDEQALKLKQCLNGVRQLSKFFDPHRLVKRMVEQAVDEGVGYLEISIDPTVLKDSKSFFSKQAGIEYHEVKVSFVIEVSRIESIDRFRENVWTAFELIREYRNVVALTLSGPEHHPVAMENFPKQMKIIEELYYRQPSLRIKIPIGELNMELSEKKAMRNRIDLAVNRGHAERITHGVSIVHERNWDNICRRMKKIALEICPTWHKDFLNSSGREHPVKMFQKYGVPIVFGSGRPGVTRQGLTDQFYEAATSLDFGYLTLKKAARDSLVHAFITDEEGNYDRNSIYEDGKLIDSLTGVNEPGWNGSVSEMLLSEKSPRVKMQIALEKAFVKFEQKLIEQYDPKNVFSHLHEEHQIQHMRIPCEESSSEE